MWIDSGVSAKSLARPSQNRFAEILTEQLGDGFIFVDPLLEPSML